jgi:outer membrane lipoprotein-sorting protein
MGSAEHVADPPARQNPVTRPHLIIALLLAVALVPASASAQETSKSAGSLEKVLDQMDATAANFRTTQASFVWDQFQKVVNDTDTQKGKVYFRRVGKDTEMMADISEPAQKFVLYSEGKIKVYQPRIDQVTVYAPGKNRADVESFLVLGFGGGGHDLLKSFEVSYQGNENVNGVDTAKLELVPKSPRVRNMFSHIVLWVDPSRGVSVQQQVFEPSGDYRLARYSDIQLNQKLPDNVFKLKTTSKTRTVTPQE